MVSTERTFLRWHIEAVWNVQLPPIIQNDVELLLESARPSWKLCVAAIADGRVCVWPSDVLSAEREALRQQVDEALDFSLAVAPTANIKREVALALAASPKLAVDTASNIARPLTVQDRALVAAFQASSSDEAFHPEKHPLIGVVMGGRLLSLAHSSRRSQEACELGIDTLPEARRKGYALASTILWTQAIIQQGHVPLYSAEAANTASLRLAAAAGYRVFARVATFEGK